MLAEGPPRRRALWISGIASFVLFAVLAAIDGKLWDEGGPGIITFELAGSEERSREIVEEWGSEGRDAARTSLWLDYPFMATYAVFWTLAAAACRDIARREGWRRFAAIGAVAVFLPVPAALFDAVENVGLLMAVDENGGAFAPRLGAVAAVFKFLLLTPVQIWVTVAVVRRGMARFRWVRVLVAALAALLVVFLAVNTWVVERQTKAAKEGHGAVLALPEGKVHVREDGPANGPPVVLIHGFISSTRWWARVTPALARRHRVIRIDLRGHGGTEKPRDGYSMEEQADLVAAAMRRVGVRRAPVIGHSMGGTVATALVERHRRLVSRLMTIGTPPDADDAKNRAGRVAFWPVIGHAIRTLAPRRMVRARLEESFIPEYDVPGELVDDIERTTYRSFRESAQQVREYWDEKPLDERLADERIPLLAVFGSEEEPGSGVGQFRRVPGARVVVLEGLDHVPHLERPHRILPLIRSFAR